MFLGQEAHSPLGPNVSKWFVKQLFLPYYGLGAPGSSLAGAGKWDTEGRNNKSWLSLKGGLQYSTLSEMKILHPLARCQGLWNVGGLSSLNLAGNRLCGCRCNAGERGSACFPFTNISFSSSGVSPTAIVLTLEPWLWYTCYGLRLPSDPLCLLVHLFWVCLDCGAECHVEHWSRRFMFNSWFKARIRPPISLERDWGRQGGGRWNVNINRIDWK